MDLIIIILWIVAGITSVIVAGLGVFQYLKHKKHPITAEVYEVDNLGRVLPYYDRFGVLLNRAKGEKMGHLLKGNKWIGLEYENYQTIKKKTMFGYAYIKVVRIVRLQEDGFSFLSPEIINPEGTEGGKLKLQINPQDVGWAVHSYFKWKGTIVQQGRFKEMLTMGLLIFGVIFVLIVSIMLIKEIPHLAEALETTSSNIMNSANAIKDSIAMQQGVIQ